MTMIRRVVVSILFSHYRTVSLQRSVHSQPTNCIAPALAGASSMPKEREQYDDGNWYA